MQTNEKSTNEAIAALRSGVRRAFLLAGVFSLAVNLLMLTVPLYMMQLFDRVLMSRSEDTLVLLTAMALGALLVRHGALSEEAQESLGDLLARPVLNVRGRPVGAYRTVSWDRREAS